MRSQDNVMPLKPWEEVVSWRKWATESSDAKMSWKRTIESEAWNGEGRILGDLDKSSCSEITQNLLTTG